MTLRSVPSAGGYDDAYFDSIGLVPSVAGGPPHEDPVAAPGRRLRPFAGATVVSRRAAVDRRRRAWVELACASRVVGRCAGTVTVTARLPGGAERRVASRPFAVRPGRMARMSIAMTRAARWAVVARRRMPGHIHVASRDGQGLTRWSSAPARLVRGRGWTRRARR